MKGIRKIAVSALAAALLAGPAEAAGPTKSPLHPVDASRVTGTATLAARGAGTGVALLLHGLAPRVRVRALLHAGTCARSGASFALVATARAAGAGSIRATGRVLLHSLPVSLGTIADGGHLIAIVAGSHVVACGLVPRR